MRRTSVGRQRGLRLPVKVPGISSVAAKLAGATIALLAMATAGIYLRLSEYQRENLLSAKELSANAVIRLFADSSAPAVVFDDPDDLRQTLATLGRNQEIEYAAVWAVDDAGRIDGLLVELRRGKPATVTAVPSTVVSRREPDRVVVVAPVRDVKSKVVGVLTAGFSLARENAAIARLKRTALLTSIAVATGLMVLLMAMARLVVVGPLAKLVSAAKRVEEGRGVDIEVSSDDEVGQLARALRAMAGAIQVREERINARNRDMRLVLDNVGQGFITLNFSGAMTEERSRIVDEWFGPVAGSHMLWDYLRPLDPAFADSFELGWSAVVDQFLPIDLCLDQLPRAVHKDERTFQLDYRPIFNNGGLHQTVVVITDITVRLARERSEQRQRETMSIYRRLLADRPAFEEFYSEGSALVHALVEGAPADMTTVKRQVHTLKGNCALFGLESVAQLCHELEERMEESGALDQKDRARLRVAWDAIVETHGSLTESGTEDSIRVARKDYDSLLGDLRRCGAPRALLAEIQAWEFEPAVKRFALVREQVERLAGRLGRAEVDVVWQPTTLRLPPRKWVAFWSAFAHVIRNTVDHGVQTTEARIAAGKSPRATIELGITQERDQVLVSVTDDGPGIDWVAIATKARMRGLPCVDRRDLEAALFAGGLSSRSESSTTSGRGLGLGAVHATVRELGGRLELADVPGRGTSLRCWLPSSVLVLDGREEVAPATAQVSVSLGAEAEGARDPRAGFPDWQPGPPRSDGERPKSLLE
ncbi:MAG TPA: ATP-binding protein [Polyangia bacterium]|jgi:two-component system chemotaxis sensor kinase CheA|nr:ATP-binding protein [Polyangia bacterium]